jgi:RNA polymerase sigma factor (TIGR02999 family)
MGDPTPGEMTLLLKRVVAGDYSANDRLAETVYLELRRLAAPLLSGERRDDTVQPTALANEAYTVLVDQPERNWQNRAHFLAVAAQAMRRLLVEHGRQMRRTAGWPRDHTDIARPGDNRIYDEVLAIHTLLDRLAAIDRRQARIVELLYFGGLTEDETAEVLQVSTRTVKRDWSVARAWLYAELARAPLSNDD